MRQNCSRPSTRRPTFPIRVALEVLPKFEIGTFEDIEIERLVADIPEQDIDAGWSRSLPIETGPIRRRTTRPSPKRATRSRSISSARSTVEVFDGGSANDVDLVLGAGSFLPGFEDQIVGMKLGETRTISVTFPETYSEAKLAGKPAEFAVTVKAIAAPGELAIDDAIRQELGVRRPRQNARSRAGLVRTRSGGDFAAQMEARASRRAGQEIYVRTAGTAGRTRIRADLESGRGRAQVNRPQLRRRRNDGRGGARRVPRHC